ncbi:hypothetical protein CR513_22366, partial [Mucuna pruriens]
MVQTQFEAKIKKFKTNNARDYFNQMLSICFTSQGIIHNSTCILDNKNPIGVLHNFYPHFRTYNGLIPRILRCTTFHKGKLDPQAVKFIFLGYSPTQKGYKCYNHHQRISIYQQMEISMVEDSSCEFIELLKLPAPMSIPKVPNSKEALNSTVENFEETSNSMVKIFEENPNSTKETPNINSSIKPKLIFPTHVFYQKSRGCTKRSLYRLPHYISLKKLSSYINFIMILNTIAIQNIVSEALLKDGWKQAMKEEMNGLERNNIWEMVDKPKGKKYC